METNNNKLSLDQYLSSNSLIIAKTKDNLLHNVCDSLPDSHNESKSDVIQIQKSVVQEKYESALEAHDLSCVEMLKELFGSEYFQLSDLKHSVQSFEDACAEVRKINPKNENLKMLVLDGKFDSDGNIISISNSVIAYMKLCVIVKALNTNWKLSLNDDCKYYPSFQFLTQAEYDALDETDKRSPSVRCLRPGVLSGGIVAIQYKGAVSETSVPRELYLCSREICDYCVKQFFSHWIAYLTA